MRVRDEVKARKHLSALQTGRPAGWPKGPAAVKGGYLVFGVDGPAKGDYRDTLPADLRPHTAGALLVVDAAPKHPLVWPHLRERIPALGAVERVLLVAWYADGLRYALRVTGLSANR